MAPRVIVINGGSSSGKTSIARQMQAMLVEPWLALSIDDFVDCLPPALQKSSDGFDITPDGTVQTGAVFTRLEGAWMAGIAATARAGAPVIIDDVFLSAAVSQARWRTALSNLAVAWVGVQCDPDVATQRGAGRPDRDAGMPQRRHVRSTGTSSTTCRWTPAARARRSALRSIVTRLHLPCWTAVEALGRQAAQ